MVDVLSIKQQFPIFEAHPGLVYLDNAATTQRPKCVIDAITKFYTSENANIHRGVYSLSAQATEAYESTRQDVATFVGSKKPQTIAFTKGTTESINIIANSFVEKELQADENIVITLMEHHANFIPWQMLCKRKSAELRIVPLDQNGDIDLGKLITSIDDKTKIVALNHISNTLGTINPIAEIVGWAHKKDVPVMIDAAQSAALHNLEVESNGIDFLAFSGHKIFGPFGVGVLYVDEKFIPKVDPYTFGGGMIEAVTTAETSFLSYPHNLDAGTSNISGVIGLSKAIDFINELQKSKLIDHLAALTDYCRERLGEIEGLQILGNPKKHFGILSFTVDEIHPHDVSSFLNHDSIAVRAGMHCTQPLLESMEIPATVRVSFSIYNSKTDVDRLIVSLKDLKKFWK
ncbi:MAG TPA: aminotransferase class V-fold PLP-dependent enzyme [Cyclobacteriaceae bacterium]